jgi:hypothetical protein
LAWEAGVRNARRRRGEGGETEVKRWLAFGAGLFLCVCVRERETVRRKSSKKEQTTHAAREVPRVREGREREDLFLIKTGVGCSMVLACRKLSHARRAPLQTSVPGVAAGNNARYGGVPVAKYMVGRPTRQRSRPGKGQRRAKGSASPRQETSLRFYFQIHTILSLQATSFAYIPMGVNITFYWFPACTMAATAGVLFAALL